MCKSLFKIILITMTLSSQSLFAGFYSEHAIGWHWYEDPKPIKEIEQKHKNNKTNDPNLIVSGARNRITTALNTAIVNPTVENVSEFIRLQEELNERSERVANVWKETLLKNPSLNYSLEHPTSKIAIDVHDHEESKKKDAVLHLFSQKTGLFFFYKSTCVYCQRFAPILKAFSHRYGIAIISISMDGVTLPEFPDSRMDLGQSRKFQVTMTPSLYAVNPYNEVAFPVSFGLVSEAELRDSIYNIMTKYGEVKI